MEARHKEVRCPLKVPLICALIPTDQALGVAINPRSKLTLNIVLP